MPRKFRFTREEIIAAALDLTRERGSAAVTARALGERLESSSKPIFSLFSSMEEVQQEVLKAADAQYQRAIQEALASRQDPPYKASGMAYIRFAREQKELFKLLFMRDRTNEPIDADTKDIRPILDLLQHKLGLTEKEAYRFHLEMWLYVHGIATMIATGYLDWDMEWVSQALTDEFIGLKYRYTHREDEHAGH